VLSQSVKIKSDYLIFIHLIRPYVPKFDQVSAVILGIGDECEHSCRRRAMDGLEHGRGLTFGFEMG